MIQRDTLTIDGHDQKSSHADTSSRAGSFRIHLREGNFGSASSEHRADLAYWKEVLHHAPPLVPITNRRRYLAPTELGSNRGSMGRIDATLTDFVTVGPTLLLAGFARALANTYGVDSIVINRWFTERKVSAHAKTIGPFDSFYPVVIRKISEKNGRLLDVVERADRLGFAHRSLDTPGLERLLERELSSRRIALRQFGFACIDAEQAAAMSFLETPLNAVAQANNEILFAAAATEDRLHVRLSVDLSVLSKEDAQRLFDTVLEKCGELHDLATAPKIQNHSWSDIFWRDTAATVAASGLVSEPPDPPNVEQEIPVTSSQADILWFDDHPDATEDTRAIMTMSTQFVVRPQISLERLKRAVDTVIWRQDAMRTRFFKKRDGWGAYLEREPSQLFVVETVADEAAALERAHEVAQQAIRVSEALFKVVVIRFGDDGDLVIAKAHHIVTDGYSLGLVLDEVVQAYFGIPLPEMAMTAERYAREFDHVGKPESFANRDKFLRELFADPPPIPMLGRRAKGLKTNVSLLDLAPHEDIYHVLPVPQENALRKRAMSGSATVSAMVSAAFARTIASLGGVDEIVLEMVHANRTNRHLEHFANNVSTSVPVRVRPSRFGTVEELACAITEDMNRAMEFAPLTDALSFGPLYDKLIANGSYTYLFQAGEVTSSKWSKGTVSAPLQRLADFEEIDMGTLKITPLALKRDLNLRIEELTMRTFPAEGGLGIHLGYDTTAFDLEEAQEILDAVLELLA